MFMRQWKWLQQARLHTAANEWAAAQPLWQQLTEANPVNGAYWLELGTAHYSQTHYHEAIDAYTKALELRATRRFALAYTIACCYARLDQPDDALNWLEQ